VSVGLFAEEIIIKKLDLQ